MRIFKEEQRFTQVWLIVILSMSLLTSLGIMYSEYTKENTTMSSNEFIYTSLILLICILPIFFFKLKTRIDEIGIHYQFFPFHLSYRTFKWNEIKFARIRTYDAISEFGGWGLKGGFFWKKSKGVAYNVSGDIGIQLEFLDGKKVLIGTQKQKDASAVLTNYENKIITDEI